MSRCQARQSESPSGLRAAPEREPTISLALRLMQGRRYVTWPIASSKVLVEIGFET